MHDWLQGNPVLLRKLCQPQLDHYAADLAQSDSLYRSILAGQECNSILGTQPYATRLERHFEPLGGCVNEADEQEIETLIFDAITEGGPAVEDLWIKISWLSFYAEDTSVRFRFSFGEDYVEDVAADRVRQHYAAVLSDAVFPESRLITDNPRLIAQLKLLLSTEQVYFVERIIYFNAPQGGAYLHHDRERGHVGVVYAQLSGATFWLALNKRSLLREIITFISHCNETNLWPEDINCSYQHRLSALASNPERLSVELESFANDDLIHLINEERAFIQQLIANGHGRTVKSGDVLLLPQDTELDCCWHTVFSLGQESGQALSFAIRADI